MKRYCYIQITQDEQESIHITDLKKQLKIQEEDIYIDIEDNRKWCEIHEKLEIGDVLYTTSIAALSLDTIDFTNKMQVLTSKKIQLCDMFDRAYHIEEIVETLQFLNTRAKYLAKQKQMEGIERSLEKKKKGEGRYGRPKTVVPDDFEATIRKMLKEKRSLENYRKTLNIKKSTFYKLVRELRDSWERN